MDGSHTESPGGWTLRLRIDGVESAGRATMVETVVEAIAGIRWARVDYALAHIDIRGSGPIDEAELVAAVAGTGCTLRAMGEDDHSEHDDHSTVDDRDEPVAEPDRSPDEQGNAPDQDGDVDGDDTDDGARSPSDVFRVGSDDSGPEDATPREAAGLNVFGIFGHVALWCLAVSLLWALAYRFLPVPMTLPMFGDAVFGNGVRNQWVSLERISPNLIRSVIASEDNEFCHHYGFDFGEIHDALREAQNGGRERGASTISQQTAKNAFLWADHSWLRKALEAYFTLVIETLWPKRRIIEVYLNIAEWGDGIYGAEAAARHWFHKPASRLNALEAARLAAILPAPNRWKASPAGPYVVSRSYTIMARANSVDLGGDDRCARP
jgi:monofunctional biosynthetic peptidoglycan transglycosylase